MKPNFNKFKFFLLSTVMEGNCTYTYRWRTCLEYLILLKFSGFFYFNFFIRGKGFLWYDSIDLFLFLLSIFIFKAIFLRVFIVIFTWFWFIPIYLNLASKIIFFYWIFKCKIRLTHFMTEIFFRIFLPIYRKKRTFKLSIFRYYYLSQNQNQHSNSNLTHTYINIVSTNQPAWGGSTYFDFNTPLYCIHKVKSFSFISQQFLV